MTRAQELLAAKARRVRLARRRVVAATLAAFVLAWGVIAFDGSMGATTVAHLPLHTSSSPLDTPTARPIVRDDSSAELTTSQS